MVQLLDPPVAKYLELAGDLSVLVLSGLRKRFGATVALDGVDVDLAPGEVHALIGENGAGKSTLLNVVAGALAPDARHDAGQRRALRPGLAARRAPAPASP